MYFFFFSTLQVLRAYIINLVSLAVMKDYGQSQVVKERVFLTYSSTS